MGMMCPPESVKMQSTPAILSARAASFPPWVAIAFLRGVRGQDSRRGARSGSGCGQLRPALLQVGEPEPDRLGLGERGSRGVEALRIQARQDPVAVGEL